MKSENGTTERISSESPLMNGNSNGTTNTNNNNNNPPPATPASKKRSGDPLKCTIFNYFSFPLTHSPRIKANIDSLFGSIAEAFFCYFRHIFSPAFSLCFYSIVSQAPQGKRLGSIEPGAAAEKCRRHSQRAQKEPRV